MNPLFDEPKMKYDLNNTINSWVGAKYHHMGENRAGIDCTKFIGKVLMEMGILTGIDEGLYYSRDWFVHGETEVVLESFSDHLNKYLIDGLTWDLQEYTAIDDNMIGDALCLSLCKSGLCNHTVIYLGNKKAVQAIEKRGVVKIDFSDHWQCKAKYYFRLFRE